MKTLVIHPKDETTDVLSLIYEGKDYTVINDVNISKEQLKQTIREHDRIILLGHGLPDGMINPKVMKELPCLDNLYFVDDSFADVLRTKETVSVWCYSDLFFRKHRIPGFHTGMIISEMQEARFVLGHCPLTKQELAKNMSSFSLAIKECIEMAPSVMKDYVLAHYLGNDEITQFNRKNIVVV